LHVGDVDVVAIGRDAAIGEVVDRAPAGSGPETPGAGRLVVRGESRGECTVKQLDVAVGRNHHVARVAGWRGDLPDQRSVGSELANVRRGDPNGLDLQDGCGNAPGFPANELRPKPTTRLHGRAACEVALEGEYCFARKTADQLRYRWPYPEAMIVDRVSRWFRRGRLEIGRRAAPYLKRE